MIKAINNEKIIRYVLAASLALVSLCFAFSQAVFDKNFYLHKYQEYGIYQIFESKQLDQETAGLLRFLQGQGGLDQQFFNSREISHLQDVRSLFVWVSRIYWLGIILLVASAYHYGRLLRVKMKNIADLSLASGVIILSSAIIMALLGINFSQSFDRFHGLFFSPGSWQFDPATDNLIAMFPQQFFQAIAGRILFNFVLIGIIYIIIASGIKGYQRYKKANPQTGDADDLS